jgi:hypothetical protein
MSERYTGTVLEVGPQEVGKSGRNKPRKLLVSDDPENYQGKTFRIWDDDDGMNLDQLKGQIVTVDYEVRNIPNTPNFTQNMVSSVEIADDPVQVVQGTLGAQVIEETVNPDYQQAVDNGSEEEMVGEKAESGVGGQVPPAELYDQVEAALNFALNGVKELRWRHA